MDSIKLIINRENGQEIFKCVFEERTLYYDIKEELISQQGSDDFYLINFLVNGKRKNLCETVDPNVKEVNVEISRSIYPISTDLKKVMNVSGHYLKEKFKDNNLYCTYYDDDDFKVAHFILTNVYKKPEYVVTPLNPEIGYKMRSFTIKRVGEEGKMILNVRSKVVKDPKHGNVNKDVDLKLGDVIKDIRKLFNFDFYAELKFETEDSSKVRKSLGKNDVINENDLILVDIVESHNEVINPFDKPVKYTFNKCLYYSELIREVQRLSKILLPNKKEWSEQQIKPYVEFFGDNPDVIAQIMYENEVHEN